MRATFCLLLAASLTLFAACGGDDDDSAGTTSSAAGDPAVTAQELADRQWISVGIEGHDLVADTVIRLDVPNAREFSVNAGCNTMSGPFTVSDGTFVVADAMQATQMGCSPELQAQDEFLSEFFQSSPAIELDDDSLTLTGTDATLEFQDRRVAEPDLPLEGTHWTVDSLVSADAVSSVAGPELEFADGKVTGTTGCNRLNGPAEVGNGTITFGPIATTRMACPDEQDVEAEVLAVLSGQVTYAIDAGTLQLSSPSGAGLGAHGAR